MGTSGKGPKATFDQAKSEKACSKKVPPFLRSFPGGAAWDHSFGHLNCWCSPQALLAMEVTTHHLDSHFQSEALQG